MISYALAPPVFDDANLSAAFEWYCRDLRDDARLDVEFRIGTIPPATPPEVRSLLLAVLQEWAELAIRHTGVGKTLIILESARLTNTMSELRLEFVSEQPDNEAVNGILTSPVIRNRVRTLWGQCEAAREQSGISARISFTINMANTVAMGASGNP